MAIVTSIGASQNFGLRTQVPIKPINKLQTLVCGKVAKASLGNASAPVPLAAIQAHTFSVSPTGAGQVYTLPTASDLLSGFGKNIDTGIPKFVAGDAISFEVVNRGPFPCGLASNATGGDGTVVTCSTGSSSAFAGSAPVGKITRVHLEWTAVNGGVNGATGTYTIYQ